jgi:hypothetical protein
LTGEISIYLLLVSKVFLSITNLRDNFTPASVIPFVAFMFLRGVGEGERIRMMSV